MPKDLATLQQEVSAFLGDELRHPRIGTVLSLQEEVGELTQEIMEREIYGRAGNDAALRNEAGDVLFSLLEFCNAYEIDLEAAFAAKFAAIQGKRAEWIEHYAPGLQRTRARLDAAPWQVPSAKGDEPGPSF